MPEAIFCGPKTVDQCVSITAEMLASSEDAVIATRVTTEQGLELAELGPTLVASNTMVWNPRPVTGRRATILAGGTSDLPVVDECRLTLTAMGHSVTAITDVGVAGLHRLLEVIDDLDDAEVLVAVAGMEGALATVLAGLVTQPLIAVPTSVGYGSAFEGQTAMASMMASCAPGIAVVGIDNGYGAACAAHRILAMFARHTPRGDN